MGSHERFRFKTLDELRRRVEELGLDLEFDEDLAPLRHRVKVGSYETPNALAVHPMEGCDGERDGRPGELTIRRYERFARGGAGLLWFEATAIEHAGRANPRQLTLTRQTLPHLREMLEHSLQLARQANGPGFRPLTVLQLTFSGRYSKPDGKPAPVIAHHDGVLDKAMGIPEDYPLISDDELDALQDRWVEAAALAQEAGFDAVDVKSCHRYLPSELLAAHTRPGKYGGAFENRTRLHYAIVERIHDEVPGLMVTMRLNAYDGHPYPWGWGVDERDPLVPDLTEPIRFVRGLRERGMQMVNITAGNPYFTPHINRPYDVPVLGGRVPDEHPLLGVARIIDVARQIKRAVPEMVVVASGYSWLRQFLGNAAAATIRRGDADLVGLGRGAFAYPDFARDLVNDGALAPKKCCITCSRCTQIMRDGGQTGCVVFDRQVYGPIYQAGRDKRT
ncbi:MAG: NADH:flavin oxidoreductase [Anaerolineae bacterium]|nr:NADH:flavin oxidoreductase [Anaerolineae bacterium]